MLPEKNTLTLVLSCTDYVIGSSLHVCGTNIKMAILRFYPTFELPLLLLKKTVIENLNVPTT